jgi:hypothetical protein
MAAKKSNLIEFAIETMIALAILAAMLPSAINTWAAGNFSGAGAAGVAIAAVVPIVVLGLAVYRIYKSI